MRGKSNFVHLAPLLLPVEEAARISLEINIKIDFLKNQTLYSGSPHHGVLEPGCLERLRRLGRPGALHAVGDDAGGGIGLGEIVLGREVRVAQLQGLLQLGYYF